MAIFFYFSTEAWAPVSWAQGTIASPGLTLTKKQLEWWRYWCRHLLLGHPGWRIQSRLRGRLAEQDVSATDIIKTVTYESRRKRSVVQRTTASCWLIPAERWTWLDAIFDIDDVAVVDWPVTHGQRFVHFYTQTDTCASITSVWTSHSHATFTLACNMTKQVPV